MMPFLYSVDEEVGSAFEVSHICEEEYQTDNNGADGVAQNGNANDSTGEKIVYEGHGSAKGIENGYHLGGFGTIACQMASEHQRENSNGNYVNTVSYVNDFEYAESSVNICCRNSAV